ncbi:MAG TPA: hypothetical protein VIL78_00640 [Hanamia sp.]
MSLTYYKIAHEVILDQHDFNIRDLPFDVLQPLANTLKLEHQRLMAVHSAKSFREERALQHQRYMELCAKNGTVPVQQFIDFPVS